jgi:hypothetical protein
MPDEQRFYRAYLLRLWRAGSTDQASWRASLEHPRTGERRGFGDLASLFAFLEAHLDVDAKGDTPSQFADGAEQESDPP